MPRKRFEWRLKSRTLLLGERTLLAGILDVSPDGAAQGRYIEPERALERALEIAAQGADLVQISAEALATGLARIAEAEELRRLVPVLKKLRGQLGIPISVMTWKSAVAAKACEHGAEILHDPAGLVLDPALAKVAVQADAGLIVSHMRGTPEQWPKLGGFKNPSASVATELEAAASRAVRAGVPQGRVMLDPGLGYGKRKEMNLDLLAMLGRLHALGYPVHVAPPLPPLAPPSIQAMAAAAALQGAHIVAAADVSGVRAALLVADEMMKVQDEAAEAAQALKPARTPGPRTRRPYRQEFDDDAKRPISAPLRRETMPESDEPAVYVPPAMKEEAPEEVLEQAIEEPMVAAAPSEPLEPLEPLEPPVAEPEFSEEPGEEAPPAPVVKAPKVLPAKPPFKKPAEGGYGAKPPYRKREEGGYPEKRPFGAKPPYRKRDDGGGFEEKRPYGDKRPFGAKPPYRKRDEGAGFEEKRPYGDKPPFGAKPPYRKRDEGGGYPEKRPFGAKPPYRKRDEGGGFEEKRPYGDKRPFGAKPPYRKRDEGAGFEEKRPYGDKRPFGAKPPYRKRDEGAGFEEKRPYGAKRPFGAKPPFGSKPPFRKREDGPGEGPRGPGGFGDDRPPKRGGFRAGPPGPRYPKKRPGGGPGPGGPGPGGKKGPFRGPKR